MDFIGVTPFSNRNLIRRELAPVIETTGAEQRALMGIVCRFGWALGCCLLPAIVYFLPNFVHIQLACTLPELLFFVWLYRIPESPRWQLARGCVIKANQELRRAAQQNKRRMTGLEEKLEQLRDKFVQVGNRPDRWLARLLDELDAGMGLAVRDGRGKLLHCVCFLSFIFSAHRIARRRKTSVK